MLSGDEALCTRRVLGCQVQAQAGEGRRKSHRELPSAGTTPWERADSRRFLGEILKQPVPANQTERLRCRVLSQHLCGREGFGILPRRWLCDPACKGEMVRDATEMQMILS